MKNRGKHSLESLSGSISCGTQTENSCNATHDVSCVSPSREGNLFGVDHNMGRKPWANALRPTSRNALACGSARLMIDARFKKILGFQLKNNYVCETACMLNERIESPIWATCCRVNSGYIGSETISFANFVQFGRSNGCVTESTNGCAVWSGLG